MECRHFESVTSRRDMLRTSAGGFGQVMLAAMAASSARAQGRVPSDSFGIVPRAKRVIFLFMWGGPSQVDLFDPKPELTKHAGKPISGKSVGSPRSNLGTLLASPFQFARHGDGGVWMSELLPEHSRHADRLAVVRSVHTEGTAHGEALLRLHTGQSNLVRPSVGAWVSYGLGREHEDLPAFLTISPPRGHGGVQNYGSAFLPAIHQGTAIGSAEIPIAKAKISNLSNGHLAPSSQRRQLDFIQSLNRQHRAELGGDRGVEGLIESYELAFRMQSTVPQVMDLSRETKSTLDLYGIESKPTDNFGRQCLLARKFAERGVRYIQVSTDYTWDHHKGVEKGHIDESAKVDRPIAGLLDDLDQRGLLDDTLVVWGGEFGRTPMHENGDGRNHHPQVFSVWMAGAGIKGGLTYGTSDDFGYGPVENGVHMHDLHATLLYALGIDHEKLTYRHAGRDFRLTDVYGDPVHELFA
ncbi:MAG: DUF1501 domain-containing protein [Planctomycetota bacterium]